ncbi:response regulator receiver protein [Thermacetogenium phaeum DSM 12270]|uniref:Stage 0 sporulation protein A homolog n=1 Tax=Thermacetogenium phaeum (strain ATCC BAA-254 / DSM 26808 / PB) TaxID=1089553 RepID=K4LFI0_THEPS|nr:response regulator [Thermacetogenium phaeum]AFV10750.1 response regulator receiver protein [Thermacetogenium phaeum DSM 12270]
MSRRVLAVDDSATVRSSLKLVLQEAGCDLVLAADGEEALNKIKRSKEKFHLIITDLNMPKMNGIELIKAVRSLPDYRFVPILMLTTESQADKKLEGKKAGATGWIVKPFTPEQLIGVIQKVLR